MRALIVLAMCGSAELAHADEAAQVQQMVAAQPQLARVEQGRARVVVRGAVARGERRELVGLVGQVVTDVERRFGLAGARGAHADIQLVLLADDARFVAAARAFESMPSTMGFYRPDLRVALANVGNSIGNLRHELVHPLIADDFPGIPAWLNEGVAALYGTARWERGKFRFLVNYRLRDLQRAQRARTLPTLAQLAASTRADVHGDQAGVYYALARYVLLYADSKGKLSELYTELRGARDAAAQRTILARHVDERAFLVWVSKLRY